MPSYHSRRVWWKHILCILVLLSHRHQTKCFLSSSLSDTTSLVIEAFSVRDTKTTHFFGHFPLYNLQKSSLSRIDLKYGKGTMIKNYRRERRFGKWTTALSTFDPNQSDNTSNIAATFNQSLLSSVSSPSSSSSLPDLSHEFKTSNEQESLSNHLFRWEDQWYPVIPLDYLKNQMNQNDPIAVGILGKSLVVWKSSSGGDSLQWSVMDDSCPHRRAPLSTGRVVTLDDNTCTLQCRYHGYEFNSNGACTKIPMLNTNTGSSIPKPSDRLSCHSYQTQCAGGLLWVYLGSSVGCNQNQTLPEISPHAIPSEREVQDAAWMFNTNPVSYLSMMENAFDPAHAPFTHAGIDNFAGSIFSPNDTIPMAKYTTLEKMTMKGFALQHTPYQQSTAIVAGYNSTTIRTFIPPSTVTVSSQPFFHAKLWFVPGKNAYETNVISYFQFPEITKMKWTKRYPTFHRFLMDSVHTFGFLRDSNLQFLSQDRITMQGQDERKMGNNHKQMKDLIRSPSDFGVSTFQRWIETIGGGGPFQPPRPTVVVSGSGSNNNSNNNYFSREVSVWDSHGKFCPKCQRTMQRLSTVKRFATKWTSRSYLFSLISTSITGIQWLFLSSKSTVAVGTPSLVTKLLLLLSLKFLLLSVGYEKVITWCIHQENKMYKTGSDIWEPRKKVYINV